MRYKNIDYTLSDIYISFINQIIIKYNNKHGKNPEKVYISPSIYYEFVHISYEEDKQRNHPKTENEELWDRINNSVRGVHVEIKYEIEGAYCI